MTAPTRTLDSTVPRRSWWITVAAAIGVGAVLPLFVSGQFWLSVLIFAGIYGIVGMGLTVLFGDAGQISFGQGGFFGIGAYVSALIALELGWPVWISMVIGAGAAGAVGFLVGFPILRLRGLSLAMATLAFAQIMFVLFRQLPITKGSLGISAIPSPQIGPIELIDARSYYYLVLAVVAVAFVFTSLVERSALGRALRTVGGNEVAAASVGIDVQRLKARALAFSAILAGLAGALLAHFVTYINADSFTLDLSILFVVIVAVGGAQRLTGALLGAFLVVAVPQVLGGTLEAYAALAYGVLLTVVFMFAPTGIVGLLESLRRRVLAWPRRSREGAPT